MTLNLPLCELVMHALPDSERITDQVMMFTHSVKVSIGDIEWDTKKAKAFCSSGTWQSIVAQEMSLKSM